MKNMKKWSRITQTKQSITIRPNKSWHRRRSSADRIRTSSAVSAVTSLIFVRNESCRRFLSSKMAHVFLRALLKVRHPSSLMIGALTLLVMLLVDSGSVYASSISITVSTDSLDLNLAPTSSSGTFGKSNNATISVSTTNSSGYALSIVADDDSQSLVGTGAASGSSFTTVGSAITESVFSSSGEYNNKWGYMPSYYNSSANTNFLPSPTTSGDTLNVTECANGVSGTDCEDAVDTYTIAIGARANTSTAIGSYSNTFTIAAVINGPPTTLQGFSSSYCSSMSVGDTITLSDVRDNKNYLVGKLADGNCWMLDNLRLDPTSVSLAALKGNTNAQDATLTYLKNGGGSSPYTATAVANKTSGFSSYNLPYINIDYEDDTTTSYGSGSGKVGVYYNYCAASAGSYCYASDSGTGDASEDLCPAGWRMPTGGSSGEYQALYATYSSSASDFRTALSTPFSGSFYSSSQSGLGSRGNFWSSTYNSNSRMHYLSVSSSDVYPLYNYNRNYGYSIRCLAMENTTYTLNFNQNTTDSVSNMPSTQTKTIQNDAWHAFTLPTGSSNIPTRSGWTFAGWSESSDDKIPTYKYDNSNGTFTPSTVAVYASDNPETLYAIWYQPQTITFTFDSNVINVEIIDPENNSVGTVSTSGDTINLMYPLTYTIKPTHTSGYVTDATTLVSGAGTLSGKKFTVGSGVAKINVASKVWDGTMQTFSCDLLASEGATIQVTDNRDDEVYLVGKLADGNCWMLDNLRLDPTSVSLSTLQGNTNASNATLTYLKNGGGSSPYTATAVANKTSGFTEFDAPNINTAYKNDTTTSYGSGSGKVGVYYNYCAVSAGSYCYASGKGTGDASEDLCPAGWRMPTGGSSGEYQALYAAYSSSASDFRTALSTTFSGSFYNSSQSGLGTHGYFWSSTYRSSSYMHSLYIISDVVYPASDNYSPLGFPIRCLASSS